MEKTLPLEQPGLIDGNSVDAPTYTVTLNVVTLIQTGSSGDESHPDQSIVK